MKIWEKTYNRKRIEKFVRGDISLNEDSIHIAADWVLEGLLDQYLEQLTVEVLRLIHIEIYERQTTFRNLRDLMDGKFFETRDGICAVKTNHYYESSDGFKCLCILLEDGSSVWFDIHNTEVKEIVV